MPTTRVPALSLLALILPLAGCGGEAAPGADPGTDTVPGGQVGTVPPPSTLDRPQTRTDTISLEGMPEPVRLELFRAPADFPLRFTAYVPEQMDAGTEVNDEGASTRFIAEFGGRRNELAFVHLFVHPAGTDINRALGVVRGYEAARGVPVSQGLEPLDEAGRTQRMPWAERAFRFRYESGGELYVGTIGLGRHEGRVFHIVSHYPIEYGDGFPARARLILDTWRWADGTPL